MKILLDECVPWPMHKLLPGHECVSVQKRGWGGTKNGDLLRIITLLPGSSLISLGPEVYFCYPNGKEAAMDLTLPAEIQKLIDERVDSGKYQTPEEVVAAAMTQLDQQESVGELGAPDLELLYPGIKEKLAEGLAAARAFRFVDGEALFEALEKEDAASHRKTT